MLKCSITISLLVCLFTLSSLSLSSCGNSSAVPRTGVIVALGTSYNYSPSVIQSGDQRQFWWCAQAPNPNNPPQNTDTIQYQSIDTTTGQTKDPVTVLAETANSWDSVFTCNPRVIRGVFTNPLGDGQTYSYEMFYVATAVPSGVDNSIGAAFSNDGIIWNKYPHPVILSTSQLGYGVGQPAVYNQDGKSSLVMFYEDNTGGVRHIQATSSDGIHFTVQGVLTTNGLSTDGSSPAWGDMGFDPATGYWYAGFQEGTRNPATVGGQIENGQYGILLYRIKDASLLTGATPWELVKTIDTNLTGYESNFLPGLLHDGYGNLNVGPYPQIQIYPSISDPQPPWNASPKESGQSGNLYKWVIGSFAWTPNQPLMALNRYANLTTYQTTTGWVDPGAGYKVDLALGHLYESPQNGADIPFYGCKNGTIDYFMSLDQGCAGGRILGLNGYGYGHPVAGISMVPLYSCFSDNTAHFVSHDPKCENRGPGTLLGYALP